MAHQPHISVIIPTRGRPAHIDACLARLARQAEAPPFEVIIVLDGPDEATVAAAGRHEAAMPLAVVQAPRWGIAEAKNRGIAVATGDLVLLLNDDVRPEPRLLAEHAARHASRRRDTPALVIGHSPWVIPADDQDTLFDRLIRESSMVFFYDRMVDRRGRPRADAGHDWGFRHAWNLNLSLPRALLVQCGGFRPAIANCCYEDVELAFRLAHAAGAPVLFAPDAIAPHDHRLTPDGYLRREWRLGYSALGLASAAPACARAIFGRDLLDPMEHAYAQAFLAREGDREAQLLGPFRRLADMPPEAGGDGDVVELAYNAHLPLKRIAFLRGFAAACAGRRAEGLFHPSDGLPAAPGLLAPTPVPTIGRVAPAALSGRSARAAG